MASLPPPPPPGDVADAPRTDARAVAALLCGIGGLLIFPFILGVVAVILGRRSRRDIGQRPWALKGLGMATSGMVIGGVSVVLYLVLIFGGAGQ